MRLNQAEKKNIFRSWEVEWFGSEGKESNTVSQPTNFSKKKPYSPTVHEVKQSLRGGKRTAPPQRHKKCGRSVGRTDLFKTDSREFVCELTKVGKGEKKKINKFNQSMNQMKMTSDKEAPQLERCIDFLTGEYYSGDWRTLRSGTK